MPTQAHRLLRKSFLHVICAGSGRERLRLGLRRRLGGLWLGDRRKRLHVESLVVRVARHEAHLKSLHQQNPGTDVALHIGRQPDFIVDKRLLEDKTRSSLHIGKQAPGKLHVANEVSLQPRDIVGLFINPNNAGELLDNFFFQFAGLELGVGLEIEHQDVLSPKALPPRVNELAGTQENFDSGILLVVLLSLLFVFLFFGFFFGLALLVLLNALLDPLVFFFLLFFAKRLAVLFHQRGDLVAIQIKERGFARVALLHFSVSVVFGFVFRLRARVVLLDLVDGLLVVVNLFEKSLEIRQLDLQLDREVKNALADGAIDNGASQSNVVFRSAAMQFDLARKLHAFYRPVVVVQELLGNATDRGGFFHDEVGLGIEEHLAFHAGSAG